MMGAASEAEGRAFEVERAIPFYFGDFVYFGTARPLIQLHRPGMER